jgi:hypothetical protein
MTSLSRLRWYVFLGKEMYPEHTADMRRQIPTIGVTIAVILGKLLSRDLHVIADGR